MTGDRQRDPGRKAGGELSSTSSAERRPRPRGRFLIIALIGCGALVAGVVALVRQTATPDWPPPDWAMAACSYFPINSSCYPTPCCDRREAR